MDIKEEHYFKTKIKANKMNDKKYMSRKINEYNQLVSWGMENVYSDGYYLYYNKDKAYRIEHGQVKETLLETFRASTRMGCCGEPLDMESERCPVCKAH